MLKHGDVNPLNVHQLRQLSWCPPHFTQVIFEPYITHKNVTDWLYENLELWGDTDEEQDEAITTIRRGLVNHSLCADAEINLSATIVELCNIRGNK